MHKNKEIFIKTTNICKNHVTASTNTSNVQLSGFQSI